MKLIETVILDAATTAGPFLPILISVLAGGAAGALITAFFGFRRSFWMRFAELERVVIDHPFLFPLWDHCAEESLPAVIDNERWNEKWVSATAYIQSLNASQRAQAFVFVELWSDFVNEANARLWRLASKPNAVVLSDRAREVAWEFDLFPGDAGAPRPSQLPCRSLDGRNGFSYSLKDLRRLHLR